MWAWRKLVLVVGIALLGFLSEALAEAGHDPIDQKFYINPPLTISTKASPAAIALCAACDDPPPSVSGEAVPGGQAWQSRDDLVLLSAIEGDIAWTRYSIASLQQGLKVNSIKVNRGNCEIDDAMTDDQTQFKFPFLLNYGSVLTIHMMCQPIEIIVYTDVGYQQFRKR